MPASAHGRAVTSLIPSKTLPNGPDVRSFELDEFPLRDCSFDQYKIFNEMASAIKKLVNEYCYGHLVYSSRALCIGWETMLLIDRTRWAKYRLR